MSEHLHVPQKCITFAPEKTNAMTTTNVSVRVPAYVPKMDIPELQHKIEQFVLLLYPRPKAKTVNTDWTMELSGKWDDNISADELANAIYESRTANREVVL